MDQPKQQIQVDVDEKLAEGTYANLALIAHSPSELVLDFARMMPGLRKAKVQARVIMTPQNAKAFMKALTDNIQKFEENFGEIKMSVKGGDKNFGFKGGAEE